MSIQQVLLGTYRCFCKISVVFISTYLLRYKSVVLLKEWIIKRAIHIFLFLVGCTLTLSSQDTIRQLITDSVQIIALIDKPEKLDFSKDGNAGNSLLNSVENQSFAAIRSGGPSVLSTILNRGMASRHLAVLWGGFNIQSVVNGTYDLGLIRNTFDEVRFYSNGTTPITGNASIAGALSLDNHILPSNSTRVLLSTTSSKNISATLINKLRYQKYHHHLALNRTDDKNEYSYKNGGTTLTQNRANFSIWSLNYEGNCLIHDRFSLTGGVWLQNSNRNIPPTKTAVDITQQQKDVNFRAFLRGLIISSSGVKFSFRGAYFDELLDYQAPGISSIAKAKIFNGSLDIIHKSGIGLSAQYRNDRVEASFFNPIYKRNTFGVLANYNATLFNSLNLGFSIRPEWVDDQMQPLGLGIRIGKDLSNKISSSLRYNKGYTLPSFNDLYWPNGGNPDLKTERSHELELGFKFRYGDQNSDALTLNLFFNLIDDWIQWSPIQGLFQPVNQRKVRNLGFEFKIEETMQLSQSGSLNFKLMYSFTDSRLVKQYLNPELDGKKSIFVPLHKINGQISWRQKTWQLHLKPLYYSKRFDSVDNSTFVSGYFLVDCQAVKTFKIKEVEFQASLTIENAFNNDYENIKFYPMPLSLFRFGLNIKL